MGRAAFLLFLLLLAPAAPAGAQASDAPAPPNIDQLAPGAGARLGDILAADNDIHNLFVWYNPEQKRELLLLYARFYTDVEEMKKRGWTYGEHGNLLLNGRRAFDSDNSANQTTDVYGAVKEVAKLKARIEADRRFLADTDDDPGREKARRSRQEELVKISASLKTNAIAAEAVEGLCVERALYSEKSLRDVGPKLFTIRQIRREGCVYANKAREYARERTIAAVKLTGYADAEKIFDHSAVEIAPDGDASRALIFDSWQSGEADVKTFAEWTEGCPPVSYATPN